MLPIFIVSILLATAMAAPTTPKPIDTLRSLVNPSPELISKLEEVRTAINATSSLAAASPETGIGQETANLNLMSGLNNIILGFLRGILDKMLTPRSSPSGNDIFRSSSGTENPAVPSYPARRPRRFNPFRISNSSPFSMFYPSMMFELMDGIF